MSLIFKNFLNPFGVKVTAGVRFDLRHSCVGLLHPFGVNGAVLVAYDDGTGNRSCPEFLKGLHQKRGFACTGGGDEIENGDLPFAEPLPVGLGDRIIGREYGTAEKDFPGLVLPVGVGVHGTVQVGNRNGY